MRCSQQKIIVYYKAFQRQMHQNKSAWAINIHIKSEPLFFGNNSLQNLILLKIKNKLEVRQFCGYFQIYSIKILFIVIKHQMTQKTLSNPYKEKIESFLSVSNVSQQSTRTLRSTNQESNKKIGKQASLFNNAFKVDKQKSTKNDKDKNQKQHPSKSINQLENIKNKMMAQKFTAQKQKSKNVEKALKQLQKLDKNDNKKFLPTNNSDKIITQEEEILKMKLRSSQASDKDSKKSDNQNKKQKNKSQKDLKQTKKNDQKQSKKIEQSKKQNEKQSKQIKKSQKPFAKRTMQNQTGQQKMLQCDSNQFKSQYLSTTLKNSTFQPIQQQNQSSRKTSYDQIYQRMPQLKKQCSSISSSHKIIKGLPKQSELMNQRLIEMRQKKAIHDFIASKNYLIEGEQNNKICEERKISDIEGSSLLNGKDIQMLSQFIYENQQYVFTITRGRIPSKTEKFVDIEIHPIGYFGGQKKQEQMIKEEAQQNTKNVKEETINKIKNQDYQAYIRMRKNAEFMVSETSKEPQINKNSHLYTYYRSTILNSRLPLFIRKYCTNVSILYSKLQKYKSTLKLIPNILKLDFTIIDQNYDKKYKFQEVNDQKNDEAVSLRVNVDKFILPRNMNQLKNQWQQKDKPFSFWSQLSQGNEQKNRKRAEILQKQLKLAKMSLVDLKTDKQRLTTMYQKEKQIKQNFYKELSLMREGNPAVNGSFSNFSINYQPQTKNGTPQSLQSPNIGPTTFPQNIQQQTKSKSNASLGFQSKQPVVEILEIDDDSGSPVMQDIESYNRSSSGQDSYYKEKFQHREYKDFLKDNYYDDKNMRRGRAKRSKPLVPDLSVYEHQTCEPGKFIHAVSGRTLSTSQILAFDPNQNQPLQGQDYMSSSRHISAANNNGSFYTNRGGSGRQRSSRTSGPSVLIERKINWQEWTRKTNNQVVKSIVQQQSQFAECKKFTKPGCGLTTMGFMELFQNVLQIQLSDNKIQRIQGLFNMKKLRLLELNSNMISRIQQLDENKQLKQLFLRGNRITKIENIFHLRKLQVLSLQSNLLTSIPQQIGDLMHLTNLYIDRNDIDKLPSSMVDLAHLRMLRILDNPKINIAEPNNKYIIDQLQRKKCIISYMHSFD